MGEGYGNMNRVCFTQYGCNHQILNVICNLHVCNGNGFPARLLIFERFPAVFALSEPKLPTVPLRLLPISCKYTAQPLVYLFEFRVHRTRRLDFAKP